MFCGKRKFIALAIGALMLGHYPAAEAGTVLVPDGSKFDDPASPIIGEPVPAMTTQQYIDKLLGKGVATVVSVAPVVMYNRYSGSHYYGLIYYRDNSLRAGNL